MELSRLSTANLEVRLGGKVIVSDISMSVGRGEAVVAAGSKRFWKVNHRQGKPWPDCTFARRK